MITIQEQEQACLHALGALPPEEQDTFERRVSASIELWDLSRSLQSTAFLLARATPIVRLPPELKGKVLGRIDSMETARRSSDAAAGLSYIMAAAQGGWKPLPIPGAFVKLLSLERERGYAVLLGKLEPGVRYPLHLNAGPEDFYILSGDLVIGDRKLVAGDFHHAASGSQHEENYSTNGCTLLAVLTTDDPLVALAIA